MKLIIQLSEINRSSVIKQSIHLNPFLSIYQSEPIRFHSSFSAHEDRHIRFFDNGSGKMIHSMVAHLDAVTSLAVDPNGLYLLSGSHDCSIRLWNLDSKTCVQVSLTGRYVV